METDNNFDDIPLTILAESDNFAVILGEDVEGEVIFNVELGSVSLHLFQEEWVEFLAVLNQANDAASG